MNRPLVSTLLAASLGVTALGATAFAGTASAAGPQSAQRTTTAEADRAAEAVKAAGAGEATGAGEAVKAANFAGTVALSNCSGSVVRLPSSVDNDPALVLTNGHCLESGMPSAGEVIVDKPSTRSFTLLNASGGRAATLKATKVSYATMTDTDVTIYELNTTYAQIKQRYNIKALEIAATHPTKGAAIDVVSGYWKRIYSCAVDGFAYRLKEGEWTWKDSVRYTPACQTIGGTSGSPVIDRATGKVAAVNNTGNEDGERCTLNNPCEVDENGQVTVRQGINYAQETYGITKCYGVGNKLDLGRPGCELPRPTAERR